MASVEPGYNSPSQVRTSDLAFDGTLPPRNVATGFVQRPAISPRRQPVASRSPLKTTAEYRAIVRRQRIRPRDNPMEARPPTPLPETTHPYAVRASLQLGSNVELDLSEDEVRLSFAEDATIKIRREPANPREQAIFVKRITVELEAFSSECEAERAGKLLELSLLCCTFPELSASCDSAHEALNEPADFWAQAPY